MKNLPTALLLTALVSPFSAQAQTKPDFSGAWKMDPSRSESAAQAEPVGTIMLVITQTPGELKVETTRAEATSVVTYKLDGSNVRVAAGTSATHWEGTKLVTEGVFDVNGATVTTTETRTLSASGTEMLIERSVVVQHGYPNTLRGTSNYVAGKDVFVRVSP